MQDSKFDKSVKIIFLFLLLYMPLSLIRICWQGIEGQIQSPIFIDAYCFWGYALVMIMSFIFLLKEKIISFSLSIKDGIRAELQQIQKEKEETAALRKELRNLAIDMLQFHVTAIENSKRFGGWSEKRYQNTMDEIQEHSKRLKCQGDEQKRIFQTKLFWEKIDPISQIVDRISGSTGDQSKREQLIAEWNNYVDALQVSSVSWLLKYIDDTSLGIVEKDEMIATIKAFE